MKTSKVLLIDSDDYSASVLLEELRQQGFEQVVRVSPGLAVLGAVASERPELVVFNHHFDRPDDLLSCSAARLAAPDAAVVAVAAAGPAAKAVRRWGGESGHVDVVLQKPLAEGDLRTTLVDLLKSRRSARDLREHAQHLASMLPDGAVAAMQALPAGQEELFEAAVLFTDIRRSSDLITRCAPREFFQLLNRSLSAQAACIRGFDGEIVKYTGDGLMAIFRGMGRSYLGLRCALELAGGKARDESLPFGTGVAEGLVLAGLVGSETPGERRQYDVIGATVHLSARLCGMAAAGEVMTTRSCHNASRLHARSQRSVGPVDVRGFPSAVECVAFSPEAMRLPV